MSNQKAQVKERINACRPHKGDKKLYDRLKSDIKTLKWVLGAK